MTTTRKTTVTTPDTDDGDDDGGTADVQAGIFFLLGVTEDFLLVGVDRAFM
jgi:hypothetical protein